MEIFPAIDILDGKCVRLIQGDFEKLRTYSTSPQEVLSSFANQGAKFVHIVDLTGAKDPTRRQLALLKKLSASSNLKIQAGGGIRSESDVQDLLESGVQSVVIGSMAQRDPLSVQEILKKMGGQQITLAMDLQVLPDGTYQLATEGWQIKSAYSILDWLNPFLDSGLERVLCTDIQRDGLLCGPSFNLYRDLQSRFPGILFQASGGISSLQDLAQLKELGIRECIVGKALYEERFTLQEALNLC